MSSLFSGHPGMHEQLAELREADLQRKDGLHRRLGDAPQHPNHLRVSVAALLRFGADRLAPALDTPGERQPIPGDARRPTA